MIVELPRATAQPPRRAMSSRLDSSQEDMGAYSSGDDAPSLGHSPNTSAKIEAGRQRVRATFLHAPPPRAAARARPARHSHHPACRAC